MEETDAVEKHKCEECGKLFSFRSNLILHRQIHSAEWQYKCNVCRQLFQYFRDLARHKKTHEGSAKHKCDICDKWFTESDMQIHNRWHSNEILQCDFCHKCFLKRATYNRHKKTHIKLTESNGEANKQFKRNNSTFEQSKGVKKLKK